MSVEFIENDVELAVREDGNDTVNEAEKLGTATPLGMRGNDPCGGALERCEQDRGALPQMPAAATATQRFAV
jgi:hypothetical protein